jgi:two-component system phosphate regulon response regulator PhoB/two-component system alkaline phosphatase synthesis response regulator PhoP
MANHPLTGKKVLWIEDDKFLGNIIENKLKEIGATFTHAIDGETALKYLETEIPDIVVSDIVLPGIDGFEIVGKIKSAERTKAVPVVLLSNLGQKNDIEKGQEYGADLYLLKAIYTLDEVIAKVVGVLEKNTAHQ